MNGEPPIVKRTAGDVISFLVRLVLGGLFFYMGLKKALHPELFLKLTRQYEMVQSPFLLNFIAATLPWFEAFCGLLLLTGIAVRGTALILMAELIPFTWLVYRRALAIQAVKAIPFCAVKFDCGCGAGEVFICHKLAENFALIAGSCWLLFGRGRMLSLRHSLWAMVLFAAMPLHAAEFPGIPGDWTVIGRATTSTNAHSFVVANGYAVEKQEYGDAEFSFRARAPEGAPEVQLWAGFHFRDRDSRYVFALRGGNNNDLYLARYAPDGKMKFLGFAPLDFKPVVGTWYALRAVTASNHIHIYLNDETLPRLNLIDTDAPWRGGRVLVGGAWLPAEFSDVEVKPLTREKMTALLDLGDSVWTPPPVNKDRLRKGQRNKYQPIKVAGFERERTEISLDGNWLFEPDYELGSKAPPIALRVDDRNWHMMHVPDFWTPGLSWLHGETGFPELSGLSRTKGVAESLYVEEHQRADGYTFDWRKTKGAWYRHYVDLPPDVGSHHFELTFDAIAKKAEVWVNGIKVGSHTGLFGQVVCDVSHALKAGRNVIAVHVTGDVDQDSQGAEKVEGVAVTVEVTRQMLRSLPHGMLEGDVAGIWQPARLTAMPLVRVTDCFIESRLDGADINLTVENSGRDAARVVLSYDITPVNDGRVLHREPDVMRLDLARGEKRQLKISTPKLHPKLWSPAEPNLYNLEIRLENSAGVVDRRTVRFGFRTFSTEGAKFLLNGKPYWLRGGNPFPNTLRPNDGPLARRFMELAHEGNIRVTRSHIVPFTSTWLDAADEVGMAVSFEGEWPWLMLRGEPPDTNLLRIWKEESLDLMRRARNHPSLVMWTVNNEMNFESMDAKDPALLKRKWLILDDMIKSMRAIDPTRPIVADSNYTRKRAEQGFKSLVQPMNLDDGDVDDAHCYFGWYTESPFHLFHGEFGKRFGTRDRPLISQEMSTGYPNQDDGHPTRFYLFKHQTPQALVGDDAFENADPAIFLKRQAFMTKELAEAFRRSDRETAAGFLHFAYFTWFQQPWSTNMQPGSGYFAMKAAMQSVLVSAELYGRHFYAGSKHRCRVCIANDSEDGAALPAGELVWEIKSGGKTLAEGRVNSPAVNYYENQWLDLDFAMPEKLAELRVDGELVLSLRGGGKTVSENSYEIVVGDKKWAEIDKKDLINEANLRVIDFASAKIEVAEIPKLREFVAGGGCMLLLHPRAMLPKLFPDQIKSYVAKQGEIVTMRVPESPVFSGIEPLDLAWFSQGTNMPIACTGVYKLVPDREDTIALASQCDLHAYLQNSADIVNYTGCPLAELRIGKGRVIACEMNLESAGEDPVAGRLRRNLEGYLSGQ